MIAEILKKFATPTAVVTNKSAGRRPDLWEDRVGTTIGNVTGFGVTLDAKINTNPVLVNGTIDDPLDNDIALHGAGTYTWNITNKGVILATGANSNGISLDVGGILDNQGLIQ